MFQKLNLSIDSTKLEKLQGNLTFSYDDEYGIFAEYQVTDIQYFFKSIKSQIQFNIEPTQSNITVIEKSGAFVPHTDVWSTALNFYIHASGEVTEFYKNPSGHKIEVEGSGGLHVYDKSKLELEGRFCANAGDCYLLDTHRPHSVTNYHNGSRKILRLIWMNSDFNTVLNSIILL
jgi:hypothetical protein